MSSSKRPRIEDSDDDEELWNEAALIDEAIIRTQSSQVPTQLTQLPPPEVPATISREGHSQDQVPALQAKIDRVLKELVKKSREKVELMKEINTLKARNINYCENNCRKQLDAIRTDLRFKERELTSCRNKMKELTQRKQPEMSTKPVQPETVKLPRVFPTLQLKPHPDLDVFEEFIHADPNDSFARKQFARWCSQRGDLDISEGYAERISSKAGCVFDKVIETKDDNLAASFLGFLAHVQNFGVKPLCDSVNWRSVLPKASNNLELLLSLIQFLAQSPDAHMPLPVIKAFILQEANWRHPKFEQLLNAVMTLVASRKLSYEGETIAKIVLRVYRQTLHSKSDPVQMNLILTGALRISFMDARLEGELVSVVTRAEAFHHLGDVLKKVIRWQPTLSLTGCPEMMEIAENSFRDSDW